MNRSRMNEPVVFKKNDPRRAKSPWCCRWVEYVDGKPKRRENHYATKGLANDRADEVLAGKVVGRKDYSELQLREIDHAYELCRGADVSLLDAVVAGLGSMKVVLGGEDRKIPTIAWAIEAYLYDGEKRGLRPATLKSNKGLLMPFAEGRKDRLVSSVSGEELLRYILAKYTNETSRKNLRTRLAGWYGWCAERPQCWVDPLPPKSLTWKAVKGDKVRPVVLTAAEAADLLAKVPNKLKAAVAVALFAGVRPEELRRIEWGWKDPGGDWFGIDVRRRKIELYSKWTKTRESRTLHDLPDNLWVWLERYPGKGKLVPISERNWYANIRKAYELADIEKVGSDIMRHTFGSHGRHRGLEWVIDTLGHTDGMKVFNRHYNNNSIGPEDAEEYFGILPV